jgi:hypothetical protein
MRTGRSHGKGVIDPSLFGDRLSGASGSAGTPAGELRKKGPNGPVIIVPMFPLGRVNLYEGHGAEGTS